MQTGFIRASGKVVMSIMLALATGTSAWAGSITGNKFVVKPWLLKSVYGVYEPVRLMITVENESGVPLVIKDMRLKWEVYGVLGTSYARSGTVNMNEMGAPPFTEFQVWPHVDTYNIIASMTVRPVTLALPAGRYSYIVSVINPAQSNAIVLAASLYFEVR